MRVVQLSDTHITHLGGTINDNFERLTRFVNEQIRPDLVVITGDVCVLSPDSPADRKVARDLFGLLDAPVRVLPGNHDVGEPGDHPWAGLGTTSDRVNAFTEMFGPDRWIEIVGEWALVGFNSELLTSDTPEEMVQWEWLATVAGQVGDRPTLVFGHKPVWAPLPGETEHAMSIPPSVLERFLETFDGIDVRAWGSGHLHHYAIGQHGDAVTVSCPSTAFVVRDSATMLGPGLEQLGVVEYVCADGVVEPFFRAVPDLLERHPLEIDEFTVAAGEFGLLEALSLALSS